MGGGRSQENAIAIVPIGEPHVRSWHSTESGSLAFAARPESYPLPGWFKCGYRRVERTDRITNLADRLWINASVEATLLFRRTCDSEPSLSLHNVVVAIPQDRTQRTR